MIIFKAFSFDAAHSLPKVPEGHKCRRVHGHTYHLKVFIEGEPNERGWVMDFADLKAAVKPVIDRLDHQYLNDIEGLENPTAEIIVTWLWDAIKAKVPQLKRLELNETPTSGVVYEG